MARFVDEVRLTDVFVFVTILHMLFCPACGQASRAQDNFFFSPNPVSQDVVEGSEVILRCDVSNRQSIVFHWESNGRMISNTSRRFQEDSDLRILRVDRDLDSGGFYCIALNSSTGGTKASSEAILNILCK